MKKYIYSIFVVALLTIVATSAFANGFAVNEQSASGLGNAYAGGGASAEDASTIFFNPAGMIYLPDNQLVIAGHAIRSSANFSNNDSHSFRGLPTQGNDGGDAGGWAFVPNLYFAKAVNDDVRLGIGINSPFAYKTDYDNGWVGRYQALKTTIKTININPSIAFKISDKISMGLGFSVMRTDAEITNAVDFGTICATALSGCGIGATFQNYDGFARVTGNDWGFGWNIGTIFQITNVTRMALAYRSAVDQKLKGDNYFNGIPAAFALSPVLIAGFSNGSVSAKLPTPDSASASIFHQINSQWDVMADLTWTHWSTFKDLAVIRTSGVLAGSTLSNVPENWDNTIRASLGGSFRYDNSLKLRAGFAYDQSPVSLEFRTPRTPNSDRFWLSVGANYRLTPVSSMDVGYTYIIVNDAPLNKTTDVAIPSLRDTVKGTYDSNLNIISVQFTHTF
jgi:long-chain fatty acid transport protein